jgi:hypothetical protein
LAGHVLSEPAAGMAINRSMRYLTLVVSASSPRAELCCARCFFGSSVRSGTPGSDAVAYGTPRALACSITDWQADRNLHCDCCAMAQAASRPRFGHRSAWSAVHCRCTMAWESCANYTSPAASSTHSLPEDDTKTVVCRAAHGRWAQGGHLSRDCRSHKCCSD